jgi:histidine triad (HIT) family protein
MEDCIFCRIISGKVPAEKIFENNEVVAFLDINPVAEGHALVVSKKHFNDLPATPDDVASAMIETTKKASKAIVEVVGAEGFNVHVNTGVAAGQAVKHVHFHIIPRRQDDGLKLWSGLASDPDMRLQLAEKIKTIIG